jgi:NAD(P)-dependent dehydrogenase (short-subunit alcohol dehydrogenase family)
VQAAVNSFAPYILTCLIEKPERIVYVSSGLHSNGAPDLKDITWKERPRSYNDFQAYCNSKLHNILLANAVAERWPNITSSSLDPEWVPTKLGGYSAPGDINVAVKTYVDLAEGTLPNASGKYYTASQERNPKKETLSKALQDKYMQICAEVTGIPFPK